MEHGVKPLTALLKAVESERETFRQFYPKVYSGIDDYTSPKIISAMMMDVVISFADSGLNLEDVPGLHGNCYLPICDMVAHQMPD